MNNCIFCKIINGEIPCHKIYENDKVLAFLDIANDVPGHTLVIPKTHHVNVFDVADTDYTAVMKAVKKISKHYVSNCNFSGVNILNANGTDAEQSVFHLHFHIYPRYNGDEFKLSPNIEKPNLAVADLCDIANKLKL